MRPSLPRTFRALRHRNYRLFFIGQGLSLIGTWLQQVAMGWLVYRLTGSAWLLGVVAFCANVGILLFSNLAGVLADRIDRRRGLLTTQSLMLVQAIVLAVLVAFGWIQTWHLIVLALWLGTCSAFDLPLRQSMYVHFIADRGDLANAIALNSMLVNTARVVGPAIAGLLLAATNEAICFALNALSFLAVIMAIVRMHWPADIRPGVASRLVGELAGRRSLCVRAETGARLARRGRIARMDHFTVHVVDAGVRKGHLRWRAAYAGLPAVGRGFRCVDLDGLSREPCHRARTRAHDRGRRRNERFRACRVRLHANLSGGAAADGAGRRRHYPCSRVGEHDPADDRRRPVCAGASRRSTRSRFSVSRRSAISPPAQLPARSVRRLRSR